MKKKFTLAVALFCLLSNLQAQITQTCFTENFNTQTVGWTYAQGASEGSYSTPAGACRIDRGIITPGVGGNNPANVTTPLYTSTGALTLQLGFDIFCVSANLSCASWMDFMCPTSIDVFYYIGTTKYTGLTDLVLPANGPLNSPSVDFSFSVGNNLPAGTPYRVEIAFKAKSGIGNCNQPGVKYILDNFRQCEITCDNCVIDGINDNMCLLANTSETVTGDLKTNDFIYSGANVSYSLANGPFANGSSAIGGANLTINANGSFTITRTDPTKSIFDFTYRVTDNSFGYSDLASAVVCFPVGGVMPVTLTDFYAKRKDGYALLTWKTTAEYNASGFSVERMDNDKFVQVGSVVASNNSNGYSYSFTEKNTSTVATQYRLKVIDRDGKFVYSEIRSIGGINLPLDFSIFPNPSNGAFSVNISDLSGTQSLTVLDNLGRSIRSITNSSGIVNITGLQSGLYFVRLMNQSTGEQVTKKLIVSK